MLQQWLAYFLVGFCLLGCTGLEVDKISDELEYRPNLSVPIGKLFVQYDEVYDLPLSLPDPLDSEVVTWDEVDTVYFNLQSSVSERKYIISLMLQFDITNRYPAEVEVGLNYINLDGLIRNLTPEPIRIEAALIDSDGIITSEKHSNPYPYQLPLSDEQIDELLLAEQLIISSKVSDLLLTNAVVDNFETYSLNAAVGIQAQVDFSINNN